jgi:P27 family predicted phage terminase small subunit
MATNPPSHLGPAGKAFWKALTADYGIDDAGGLALVGIAAECLDRMREAQKSIKKDGISVATGTGGLKTNPAVRIEHDSHNRMIAALRSLNLDLEPLRDRTGRPPGTYNRPRQ